MKEAPPYDSQELFGFGKCFRGRSCKNAPYDPQELLGWWLVFLSIGFGESFFLCSFLPASEETNQRTPPKGGGLGSLLRGSYSVPLLDFPGDRQPLWFRRILFCPLLDFPRQAAAALVSGEMLGIFPGNQEQLRTEGWGRLRFRAWRQARQLPPDDPLDRSRQTMLRQWIMPRSLSFPRRSYRPQRWAGHIPP